MISAKLLIYLAIGTTAMLIPIVIQMAIYRQPMLKSLPLAALLTVAGTVGTWLLFFLENGWLGGTSFYGAVFFVPLAFIPVAMLLRMPYTVALDMCAPAECAMLVIMKVQCYLSGCCGGRVLWVNELGQNVVFPSQLAELVNALVLMVILLLLSRREKNRGLMYPIYMLLYGASRLVLNYLREQNTPFALGLPAGAFWSVCAIALGTVLLFLFQYKRKEN